MKMVKGVDYAVREVSSPDGSRLVVKLDYKHRHHPLRAMLISSYPHAMLSRWIIDDEYDCRYLLSPDIVAIINKHLKGDKDILLCQDELIEAGFEEFARL